MRQTDLHPPTSTQTGWVPSQRSPPPIRMWKRCRGGLTPSARQYTRLVQMNRDLMELVHSLPHERGCRLTVAGFSLLQGLPVKPLPLQLCLPYQLLRRPSWLRCRAVLVMPTDHRAKIRKYIFIHASVSISANVPGMFPLGLNGTTCPTTISLCPGHLADMARLQSSFPPLAAM